MFQVPDTKIPEFFLGKLTLIFSPSIIFKLDGPGDYLHATKWIFHSKKKMGSRDMFITLLIWGFWGCFCCCFWFCISYMASIPFFPEGTDLTNHSSLNKYHSEQCCWEESCLKRLLIVTQLPEKLKLCCFTQLISPLASTVEQASLLLLLLFF